jgi:hypothetical protein
MYHRKSRLIGPECHVSTRICLASERDIQQSKRRPLRPSVQCASRSTPFRLGGACMSKLSLTRKMSGSPRDRAGRTEVPCRTILRQVEVVCDSKRCCYSNVAPVSCFTDTLQGCNEHRPPVTKSGAVLCSPFLQPFSCSSIIRLSSNIGM